MVADYSLEIARRIANRARDRADRREINPSDQFIDPHSQERQTLGSYSMFPWVEGKTALARRFVIATAA
jgi:hypothetical protein